MAFKLTKPETIVCLLTIANNLSENQVVDHRTTDHEVNKIIKNLSFALKSKLKQPITIIDFLDKDLVK